MPAPIILEAEERNMKKPTRRTLIVGGLSACVAGSTRANPDWPDRLVTMVHGFPPGGTVDLVARVIADGLAKRIGHPIVVAARTGASGTTALLWSHARHPMATRYSPSRPGTSSSQRLSKASPIERSMILARLAPRPNIPTSWSPMPTVCSALLQI